MFLAMLSLFRERLPCSENYWRYKRNYEMHMTIINKDRQKSVPNVSAGITVNSMEEHKDRKESIPNKKILAPSHMSFVKPLVHYNEEDIHRKLSVGNADCNSPYVKDNASNISSTDAEGNKGS